MTIANLPRETIDAVTLADELVCFVAHAGMYEAKTLKLVDTYIKTVGVEEHEVEFLKAVSVFLKKCMEE